MKRDYLIYCLTGLLCVAFLAGQSVRAAGKPFTVVIDAGHGGKDPGAIGKHAREKNINLGVALKLGEKIRRNHPDIKIVYTRKTDKFVELQERSAIANRAKADLFISIHTNSAKSASARGTETYTLGLARTEENLEVAKRENSVILLEDDFTTRYEGFDPKSTESYIMFEFLQDKHMEQSINLASSIQKEFKGSARRNDRGVRQAGFLVLRTTGMPSVLVELGYISNPDEEKYLNSEKGQHTLAQSIYQAFKDYKTECDRKQKGTYVAGTGQTAKPERTPSAAAAATGSGEPIVYKIQFLTSGTRLKDSSPHFKGLKEIDWYQEKGLYKYTCYACTSKQEIERKLTEVRKKFKDAFIVRFQQDKKIK